MSPMADRVFHLRYIPYIKGKGYQQWMVSLGFVYCICTGCPKYLEDGLL